MRRRPRSSADAPGRHRRIAAYSACAGAALLSAAPADPAIISVTGMAFTVTAGMTSVDWNVDSDADNDFRLAFDAFNNDRLFARAATYYPGMGRFIQRTDTGSNNDVRALPTTVTVQMTLAMPYAFIMSSPAQYLARGTPTMAVGGLGMGSFVGFQFTNAGGTRFGWAQADVVDTPDGPRSLTVNEWAYEDTGAGIRVGDTGGAAIPEPSSLALLAMGAAGLLRLRQRRDPDPDA